MTTALRPPNVLAPFDSTKIAWHIPALKDKALILLLTGSKGGGKSRLAAEKVHAYCLKYPGAMGLIVRKTRETMMNSTVLFLQAQVMGGDTRVKWNGASHRFEYQNGSFLAIGGMKDEEQRQAVRSIGVDGALDIAWMEEANLFDEGDFGEIIGCLRGKAAKWQQIILTTNPDGPDHWIRRLFMISGKKVAGSSTPYHFHTMETELPNGERVLASTYYSSADTNPFNAAGYKKALGMLTGVQYQRLVLGRWVQSEGAVYDNFDADLNVADVKYNPAQAYYWCVDDGYVQGGGPGTITYHPRVFLACQDNERGGMNVLCERYKTEESNYEMSITAFQDKCEAYGVPREPDLCYVDSSAAMLRGALGSHGLFHSGATHNVLEGIRNLRRLIADGQDTRLLQIHPDCTNLIREFQMYQYEEVGSLPGGERKPAKKDDHGCFVAGTLVTTRRGNIPIEQVRIGDEAWTWLGYRKVTDVALTIKAAETYTLYTQYGQQMNEITATGDHRVWTGRRGYVPLRELESSDILCVLNDNKSERVCQDELTSEWKWSYTGKLPSDDTLTLRTGLMPTISGPMAITQNVVFSHCTEKSGQTSLAQSLKVTRFTTRIKTLQTMFSQIFNWLRTRNTPSFIKRKAQSGKLPPLYDYGRYSILPPHGMAAMKVGLGIQPTGSRTLPNGNLLITSATIAEASFVPERCKAASIAQTIANLQHDESQELTIECETAPIVGSRFSLTNTARPNAAPTAMLPSYVSKIVKNENREDVYNITVDEVHHYFANGVLVRNCDSLRYGAWHLRTGDQ